MGNPETRKYVVLAAGDPAPWFRQRSLAGGDFNIDVAAGRYILLCFFASAGTNEGRAALAAVARHRRLFDDDHLAFFGVTHDANDEREARIVEAYPGIRHFLDYNGVIGQLYGALPTNSAHGTSVPVRCQWVLLDPTLRIARIWNFDESGADHVAVFSALARLPKPGFHAGFEVPAPILIIPDVFNPEMRQMLIDYYGQHGGEDTGFMTSEGGRTVGRIDFSHKRRKDCMIEDVDLMRLTQKWVQRRIVPEILKVHQFKVTRMERYLIGCYSAEDGGHFRAHRDNTTAGTAHRRFAVSINLTDDFEGGEVIFPEYGMRGYKAPAGGAVIFSCSLLHMVSRVTAGRRFAFLPFLYDEAASALRERNNALLDESVERYDPNREMAA
ncbi:MAG: 2OG-Fe(II) oxygenase [Proteobacteria bacterium]|nr:2OG-Fe(II) oxygenase [Pseudomonadota bacterium]